MLLISFLSQSANAELTLLSVHIMNCLVYFLSNSAIFKLYPFSVDTAEGKPSFEGISVPLNSLLLRFTLNPSSV